MRRRSRIILLLFAASISLLMIGRNPFFNSKQTKLRNSGQKYIEPNIIWNNQYWQQVDFEQGSIFLWKAYFDDRQSMKWIRILAMTNHTTFPELYCHGMDKKFKPVEYVEKGDILRIWTWHHLAEPQGMQPLIISCPMNHEIDIPYSVSLSFDRYFPLGTNNLMVTIKKEKYGNHRNHRNHRIAICQKWLAYYKKDISLRMIEWLEMVKILGAGHVFMSKLNVHPNISKVLDYYQSTGFISLNDFTLPGNQPNDPKEQHKYIYMDGKLNAVRKMANEMISLFDSLYRSIQSPYKYIVIIDTDELILPKIHNNWYDLLDHLESSSHDNHVDSYQFDRIFYANEDYDQNDPLISDIPKYLHILRHIWRWPSKNRLTKGFIQLDRVVTINNHYPTTCSAENGKCEIKNIKQDVATIPHYRSMGKRISKPVVDTLIWKYRKQLEKNVNQTLFKLGWLNK